ncbi:MAG: hypothetical protein R2848_12470 [Thermomicrobiales bacterium]
MAGGAIYPAKQFAFDWLDQNRQRLSDFDLEIWGYAEPAWREYKSAKAYVDLLRSDGWEVEEGSGGMPTAFAATWSNGPGPVIGSYAEYDAVPGNSQQAVPYQAPREGLHPWTAGHTDPHSMLGVGALGGMLATKAAMQANDIGGTLKFFGEPAEKVCGSKPVHAAKGYFDGADAFLCYHPLNGNTVTWETHCGSYWSAVFTFECAHPEEWAARDSSPRTTDESAASSHIVARVPGAIDALMLMYTMTKYTKEAMFPHTGTWTLNEFVLAAGDATSDNLPRASPRFSTRGGRRCSMCNSASSMCWRTTPSPPPWQAVVKPMSSGSPAPGRVGEQRARRSHLSQHGAHRATGVWGGRDRVLPGNPAQSRSRTDGEPHSRGLYPAHHATAVRGRHPFLAALMAEELHLG